MTTGRPNPEHREEVSVAEPAPFDMEYFKKLEGDEGWVAVGNDDYENQEYFTVKDEKGRNLGVVGVYDFGDQKRVTHTVVDPEFRGRGLAAKFKMHIAEQLGLDSFLSTISPDNTASLRAIVKVPGARRVSTEDQERDGGKIVYEWRREWMEE